MAKVTWHGHATCSLETDDGTHLVIDPFFGDNPACKTSVDEVEADYILVSHGHYDHIAFRAIVSENPRAQRSFELRTSCESE